MGPAHTNRELKPRKRRNTTRLQHLFPNKTPRPPKNAVWKVLVTARGGSTPRNPKGILLLSAWCFPLGCSGACKRESWCKITRKFHLPPNSGYLTPEGCLLQLCGKPGPRRVGSQAGTQAASGFWCPAPCRYQNVPCRRRWPGPTRLCRQSLPRWLLGEVRGF